MPLYYLNLNARVLRSSAKTSPFKSQLDTLPFWVRRFSSGKVARCSSQSVRTTLNVLLMQIKFWKSVSFGKRIRRGLFGQSIVDFSKHSEFRTARICERSCIQLQESAKGTSSHPAQKTPQKTPRDSRSFAQARALAEKCQRPDIGCADADDSCTVKRQSLISVLSLYNFSHASRVESHDLGDEKSIRSSAGWSAILFSFFCQATLVFMI